MTVGCVLASLTQDAAVEIALRLFWCDQALRFRMRRSIGLIQIRMSHPSSSCSMCSSEKFKDEFGSGIVKYGILQLPGSDELDTHVAHGVREKAPASWALAQGVVYINHKSKGFDDSLIRGHLIARIWLPRGFGSRFPKNRRRCLPTSVDVSGSHRD